MDPSYRTLERLDHTQTLKKRVCKLNLLKFDKNQFRIDEIFNQNFHVDYQKPNTLAEINAILNVDPSVIFTSEKLFDGEIICRYNYLIQPNHPATIKTGLKMKAGAPIFMRCLGKPSLLLRKRTTEESAIGVVIVKKCCQDLTSQDIKKGSMKERKERFTILLTDRCK